MPAGWVVVSSDPGTVAGATVTPLAAGRWLVVHPDDIGTDLVSGTGRTSRYLRGLLAGAIASGEGDPPEDVLRAEVDSAELAGLASQAPGLALGALRAAVASLAAGATARRAS